MKMNRGKEFGKIMVKNAVPFLISLCFIMVFGALFGPNNTLLSVALAVGLTMLPLCDLKIRPQASCFIIFLLYMGSAVIGQFALLSPYLSFVVNFLFVFLILLLSKEPEIMKPSISFLLCFVFCQSTKVPWEAFQERLLCAFVGSILVIITCLIFLHKKGSGKNGRTLKEQMFLCNQKYHYMFRLSFGIALAMFIGMIFHLKKPLWISIVVKSLTQVEWEETKIRMRHRFIGNLLGVLLFFCFFQLLLPKQYAMYVIMLFVYLATFTSEYKYKQAINAISALQASLVLLDTKEAILDRLFSLAIGIVLVFLIYELAEILKKVKQGLENMQQKRYAHGG